jgi:hypothetical protein
VARNPWRARARLLGVVAAGIVAGIIVGALLIHFIIMRWSAR